MLARSKQKPSKTLTDKMVISPSYSEEEEEEEEEELQLNKHDGKRQHNRGTKQNT